MWVAGGAGGVSGGVDHHSTHLSRAHISAHVVESNQEADSMGARVRTRTQGGYVSHTRATKVVRVERLWAEGGGRMVLSSLWSGFCVVLLRSEAEAADCVSSWSISTHLNLFVCRPLTHTRMLVHHSACTHAHTHASADCTTNDEGEGDGARAPPAPRPAPACGLVCCGSVWSVG